MWCCVGTVWHSDRHHAYDCYLERRHVGDLYDIVGDIGRRRRALAGDGRQVGSVWHEYGPCRLLEFAVHGTVLLVRPEHAQTGRQLAANNRRDCVRQRLTCQQRPL